MGIRVSNMVALRLGPQVRCDVCGERVCDLRAGLAAWDGDVHGRVYTLHLTCLRGFVLEHLEMRRLKTMPLPVMFDLLLAGVLS